MDVFESEPYLGLFPKWLTKMCAWGGLLFLLLFPPSRDWLFEQAQRHVLHEIQPFIDHLVPPSDPGPRVKSPKP